MSLPPVPRELRGYMTTLGRHVTKWFDDLQFILGELPTNLLISLGVIPPGFVVKVSDAAFAQREIEGTANEIDVADGDAVAGNPTISLPLVIASPRKFGSATDNTEVEADGTVKFNGSATVFKDVFFPMAPPKATGAGNPTLVTWNDTLRGYIFAVGDVHDFDPQEFPHDGQEGATATWHIHFVSRTDVASTRNVKYQLGYSKANRNEVFPSPTTVSVNMPIPANTPVNTHMAFDIGTFTTGTIASQMFVRLTRIASVGNEPETDPVVIGVHYHYPLDTVGSRAVFTK